MNKFVTNLHTLLDKPNFQLSRTEL